MRAVASCGWVLASPRPAAAAHQAPAAPLLVHAYRQAGHFRFQFPFALPVKLLGKYLLRQISRAINVYVDEAWGPVCPPRPACLGSPPSAPPARAGGCASLPPPLPGSRVSWAASRPCGDSGEEPQCRPVPSRPGQALGAAGPSRQVRSGRGGTGQRPAQGEAAARASRGFTKQRAEPRIRLLSACSSAWPGHGSPRSPVPLAAPRPPGETPPPPSPALRGVPCQPCPSPSSAHLLRELLSALIGPPLWCAGCGAQ